MMISAGNILFAKLNLPVLDKALVTKKLDELNMRGSVWDNYRGMYLTPLMLPNSVGEFLWTEYAPDTLIEWAEEVLFPFTETRAKIALLHTPPRTANGEHIDCDRHELNTRQHKFRIVLRGTVDSLYFITDKGNVSPPNIDQPFIMDGGWPHGMHNDSDEPKFTIAMGYPWTGLAHYDDKVDILLNRNDYKMPANIDNMWER